VVRADGSVLRDDLPTAPPPCPRARPMVLLGALGALGCWCRFTFLLWWAPLVAAALADRAARRADAPRNGRSPASASSAAARELLLLAGGLLPTAALCVALDVAL